MIAAISNTGTLRFQIFQESFTGPVFLDFCKRLVTDAKGRKVILILDGHPAHRARLVKDWIAERPELIELPVTVEELKDDVRRFLFSCQRRPAKVARYFHERHVRYAAATP